ncbi:MAG: ABC transporter permease [Chloroflexota bacterium]|nr:ABC transporter permease [Chloroflexota bacterium]MEE3246369.1 ABC transporter permease [Chloroflexota bacterium]
MSTIWLVLSGTLTGAVGPGISVLYATYGELITERAGRINLGTEGSMLMGACFGFIATVETGSASLGVLAGMVAGSGLSLVLAYLVIYRDTNQLATGFALTLFGAGITAYAGRDYVDSIIGGLNPIAIPLLSNIPEIGKALFQQDILAYIAYALGPLLWVCLYYTRPGLSLRAVGESVDVAFAAGRNPQVIQIAAIAMGGALAGLGGAQLSLGLTHTWSEGMTVGRGFVAVGLVIFGMWSPLRAMIGALLFGGAIGLQLQLQTVGAPVSPFILDMLPYVVILLVMALWSRASARAMPEGLKGVLRATS